MGCSISGCILFERKRSTAELQGIQAKLRNLIIRAEDRGRDSYGIVSIQRDGRVHEIKRVGRPSDSLREGPFVDHATTIVLNNDRAEPTTEFIAQKTSRDIQPFGNSIIVAHNGVIANDKDLERGLGLRRESRIDTAILPPLLEKRWDGSVAGLQRILRDDVMGSFALAIASRDRPDRLYLACNYKPIFLEYDQALDTLFFTSLESYLQDRDLPLWESNPIRQMRPYSILKVTTRKESERASLWRADDQKGPRKALVICSAGLDSTVAAKVMKDRGYDLTLLHFKYRHRAERREAEAVERLAAFLGCNVIFVDSTVFKDVIRHSRLTETLEEIVKDGEGLAGAEFAHEWVPARNLIFLSIAAGIAEGHGYDTIALGNNLEEAGAYPDNEMIFVQKLNEVLPYATNLQKRVRIEMPVGNLMKHEIVKMGIEIGAPLHLTWSCYEGGETHCGTCGPCFMRRMGFEINGLKDPVFNATQVSQTGPMT